MIKCRFVGQKRSNPRGVISSFVWLLSSLIMRLLLTFCSIWALAQGDSCNVFDTDFSGVNVNNGLADRVDSASECRSLCEFNSACNFWSWVGPEFQEDLNYIRSCWLKADPPTVISKKGVVSGPKNCASSTECCQELRLDATGMGDFYQGDRLGLYRKYVETSSGRNVYQQVGGEQFLYYLDSGLWMVGDTVGNDLGGILNRGSAQCPEDLTGDWEYWGGFDEWEEDWTMEATCQNSGGTTFPPNAETCNYGTICESCSHTSEENGILYCCSVDCNSGWIETGTQNGNAVCRCGH
eukprot:maker-scaffold84_size396325-snap-gene-2.37 protein:Tk09689 transcript:maker-scaffold84_size396325-snap-gene-2.37-mRNA-1 annotation:"pan domain-containing protein"